MSAITPTLQSVLAGAVERALRSTHTGMPARVERYDAARQAVDVQPLVMRGYLDEARERATEALPVVPDVPVIWPGGGGFGLTFPLAAGDKVWLMVASCSLDRWLQRGDLVDPEDDRHHALIDAVALPDLRDFAHARSSAPTDCARLGYDGGAAIELRQADVRIGGGAGHEATFKAETYLLNFSELIGQIATHVGTSGTPAGATAAGTAITSALADFMANQSLMKTTIAKVK